MLALQVFQSCLSVLVDSFIFRERLRPSRPPVSFLQGSVRKKKWAEDLSSRWQASSSRLNACVPRRHCRGREYSPVLFTQHDQRPSAVSDIILFGASDGEIDDSLFYMTASDTEESLGCVTDPALLPTSSSCNTRLKADEELICIMTKAVNELGHEWSPLRRHLVAGWMSVFSRGAIKPPANTRPPSSPKIMTSSRYCGMPPTRLASVLLLPLFSHQLTALKRKDTSACPLWMSPWPRISARPQLSDGRRGRAIRPSCTLALAGRAYSAAGQASSALHSTAVLQVFQAKILTSEGSRSGCSFTQESEEHNRPGPARH